MGEKEEELLIKLDGEGGLLEAISDAATLHAERNHAASSTNDDHLVGNETEPDANFVTLPAFRLLCLSNPILETFFSSQLPASFKLEPADRANINGTSIWHDIPSPSSKDRSHSMKNGHSSSSSAHSISVFQPPSAQNSPKSTSSPMKKSLTSIPPAASTTLFSSNMLTPKSSSTSLSRAYSKDVSTGMVGRIGGFLNTFLGDEVKAKVDELADSIGEKLNTKVVKGPLPSFANLSSNEVDGGMGRLNGVLDMDEIRAMEEERRERRRIREMKEKEEEYQKRGINVHSASEQLRKATAAVVEARQAPEGEHLAEHHGAGLDDDEDDVIVVEDDVVHLTNT